MLIARTCRSWLPLVTTVLISSTQAAEMFPYTMPWDDASSNLTNISEWNDKPAGKDGFVLVKDGHFFANGKRLRFIGANITGGGGVPSHEDADRVAARLSRFGFNIVRFHHMDSYPAPNGLLDKELVAFDPVQMDKFDYFVHALKRVGIYTDLNLYTGRRYPGMDQPEVKAFNPHLRGVDLFLPSLIANQKENARDLLTHRNTYTGNRYCEEPAVALIEINNEDGLITAWRRGYLDHMPESIKGELQTSWNIWLHKHYSKQAELNRAWETRNVPLGVEMLGKATKSSTKGWTLQTSDQVAAKLVADNETAGPIDACVSVEKVNGTEWHVQLHQVGLGFKANLPYTLKLRLRSDESRKVKLAASQNHAPWQPLWQINQEIDSEWKDLSFTFVLPTEDPNARFTIGNLGAKTGTVWISNPSLKPGGRIGLKEGESLENSSIEFVSSDDFSSRMSKAQQDWLQFLWDTEAKFWTDMRKNLKEDLGVKSLLIGSQASFSPAPIQAQFDVIDDHSYWQHPRFPGRYWDMQNWRIDNSPLAGIDGAGALSDLALHRIPGKPFTVSEYNHPAPSEYTAEMFPILAAYGALQDWDGFFVYSYGSNLNWNTNHVSGFFDINADPNKMTSLIAAAAMFRRGDVSSSAPKKHRLPPNEKIIDAMRGRRDMPTASMFGVPPNIAVREHASLGSPPGPALPLPIKSDTGQLVWGAEKAKTVTINTPKSKGLIGAKLAKPFDASGVGLQLLSANHDTGVILVTLIEGDSFSGRCRALVTTLGSEINSEQTWQDAEHSTTGSDWGRAPVLVEGIAARVTLPVPAKRVTAWTLDERGDRRDRITVSGTERAVIETGERDHSLWYEIEVE